MLSLYSILSLILSCWILNINVNALPIQQQQQSVFISSSSHENTIDAQEYSVYSSIIEYYENLVDTTLSSESEELLINLIHLPKESMKNILSLQAESMGFKTISGKRIYLFKDFR